MAEAILASLGGSQIEAVSAGSHPKDLHPNAVRVMRERGIDISGARSKHLSEFAEHRFDYVISLCDRVREVCPDFPGPPARVHWSIPDPAAEGAADQDNYPVFVRTADELNTRIQFLLYAIEYSQTSSEDLDMPSDLTDMVSVRYMVDDVDAAIDFYTKHLGFTLRMRAAPAFADVVRGRLRLLLSGPTSSAGRSMPDGTVPAPGGWNRIHLIVSDIAAEVDRLRAAGLAFRNDIVKGPGGQQILLEDPSGNVVELFQPAGG
ncbi:Glutaredoxin arsenate reductase [Arthrobacter sp. Bi83]|nr:Glutaredoxin arsenate reductase [Arthrobacter sp. Bi83]